MVFMSLSYIIGAFYIFYYIFAFFRSIHHFYFTVVMTKICLAPMLDVTTPPFCNLVSLINPEVELFSEMLVDNMILNVDKLALDERAGSYPKNTVIQLGGSDCNKVSQAIQILIKYYGYTRYNLNCGCPSNKVKKGAFGASLMKDPANVASIINKVYNDTGIVISIKCRIGIVENKKEAFDMNSIEVNEDDDFEFFHSFVKTIMETTPCKTFYVHCRKCVLEGLSPKGNRNIPKLMYSYAHRMKAMYNDLEIIVNGGVKLPYKEHILGNCDGVMIGRMAMDDPTCFRSFNSVKEKEDFLLEIIPKYMSHLKVEKLRMYHILPILNLRKGMRNAKLYKQTLIDGLKTKKGSEELCKLLIDHINENRRDEEILEQ